MGTNRKGEPTNFGSNLQKKVLINRKMVAKKADLTAKECEEMEMSPAQREVFLIVDEWWKKFGFSPSLRDIANQRGKMGLGNTMRLVDRLVELGVFKKIDGCGRTVRPVYINFRNLE
jgi:sulfur relay (sulfurtransferase) DsrC/TusE family protein